MSMLQCPSAASVAQEQRQQQQLDGSAIVRNSTMVAAYSFATAGRERKAVEEQREGHEAPQEAPVLLGMPVMPG
jgi:hypothetical protein